MHKAEAKIRLLQYAKYRGGGYPGEGLVELLSNERAEFVQEHLHLIGCAIAAAASEQIRKDAFSIVARKMKLTIEAVTAKLNAVESSEAATCPSEPFVALDELRRDADAGGQLVPTHRPTRNGPLTCLPQFLSTPTLDAIASSYPEIKNVILTFRDNSWINKGINKDTQPLMQPLMDELGTRFRNLNQPDYLREITVDVIKRGGGTSTYHHDPENVLRVIQPIISDGNDGKGTRVVHGGAHYQCDEGSASLFTGGMVMHKSPASGGLAVRVSFALYKPTLLLYRLAKFLGDEVSNKLQTHYESVKARMRKEFKDEATRMGYSSFESYANEHVENMRRRAKEIEKELHKEYYEEWERDLSQRLASDAVTTARPSPT